MKKYEDRPLHRMLYFGCSLSGCSFRMDEMNGWFEEVPEICPVCKEGKVVETFTCPNIVNIDRQRNWRKGLTQAQITDCLTDHSKNPY